MLCCVADSPVATGPSLNTSTAGWDFSCPAKPNASGFPCNFLLPNSYTNSWDLLFYFRASISCELVFKQIGVRGEFAAQTLKLSSHCVGFRDKGASLHVGIAELCLSHPVVSAGKSWVNTAPTHQAGLAADCLLLSATAELLSALKMRSVQRVLQSWKLGVSERASRLGRILNCRAFLALVLAVVLKLPTKSPHLCSRQTQHCDGDTDDFSGSQAGPWLGSLGYPEMH